MDKPKIAVFANSKTIPEECVSCFQALCRAIPAGLLRAEIVAVVSSQPEGDVFDTACEYEIPLIHMEDPRHATEDDYRQIMDFTGAEFMILSGWVDKVRGPDPRTTVSARSGSREFVMRFVQNASDVGVVNEGPIFFRKLSTWHYEHVGSKQISVIRPEHDSQVRLTNMVVNRQISWDGVNADSLRVPESYCAHLPIGQNGMRCVKS